MSKPRAFSGGVKKDYEARKANDAATRNKLPRCYKCDEKPGTHQCDFIVGQFGGHEAACAKYLCEDHVHKVPSTKSEFCYEHYVIFRTQRAITRTPIDAP